MGAVIAATVHESDNSDGNRSKSNPTEPAGVFQNEIRKPMKYFWTNMAR